MLKITPTIEKKKALIALEGRLDTLTARDFDKTLMPILESVDEVVIDCKELEYISSSGLRIFLTLRKAAAAKGGSVIVRSLNPDVRNVFMMTGFLNLFKIEG